MPYYSKKEYKLKGFEKSKRKNTMYNALLEPRKSSGLSKDKKIIKIPFGHSKMQNYHDKTGLNAYPHLIHGDKERRRLFRARHKGYLRKGYYSPSFFSYYYLW